METPVNIAELSELMNQFVSEKGWYSPDSKRPQTARNLACSLCLESAEVLEHFQWNDSCKNTDELAGELADVALYLLQLAWVSGIDLEEAILTKLRQNKNRSWDA
jgi:NTP pyrophosphatase (non-canonical NTP hydrolase)